MKDQDLYRTVVALGTALQADLAEYSMPISDADQATGEGDGVETLQPDAPVLAQFDARITDADLRLATRTRFATAHYADAVESAVKALNELIRARTGRTEDGDALMTVVFSPNQPLLRIGSGKTKSDESRQRGHMQLCQGVVGAWRNPRAHSLVEDHPSRALGMIEAINELMTVTRSATRTRKKK